MWKLMLAALAMGGITGFASPGAAQVHQPAPVQRCWSLSLAPGHWAVAALEKVHALGLADPLLPPQRAVPLCAAYRSFLGAAAQVEDPALAGLFGAWVDRLETEYPGLPRLMAGDVPRGLVGAALGLQVEHRNGAAAPGGGGLFFPERTGALPLGDVSQAAAGAEVAVALARRLWVQVSPELSTDGPSLGTTEAVLGVGPLAVSAGRGYAGYGTARSGAIVLGQAQLDRVQIETIAPLTLPAPLDRFGRIGFTTLLSRLVEDRHAGDPFFWAAALSVQPHWRATVSVHRAAMFPDDHGINTITAPLIRDMLIGRVVNESFENQVVSLEARFHLPTEALLPVTAYFEWGAEDASGAWWRVPGRVVGVYLPALPGAAHVAAGVERSSFAVTCCSNPMWYRHGAFQGSWAVQDRPLGHPLGGHGVEWMGYGTLDVPDPGITLDARILRRDRRADNLFVPGREGGSWGAESSLRWHHPSGWEIFAATGQENGAGWRERYLNAGGRFFLRAR
jgi:hypothetical protein